MGHVLYLRTPPGDNSYSYPNLPSYIGEYLAGRVLGTDDTPELVEAFQLSEDEFESGDEGAP